MKFLTDRQEIAKAMNFKKFPVIDIDFGREENLIKIGDEIGGFRGCKVVIPHKDSYAKCEVQWFKDTQKIIFGNSGFMLTNDFGYSDVMDMLETANAPEVDVNQEVVIVLRNSKTGMVAVAMTRTSAHKDILSSTVLSIDERVDLMNFYQITL